VGNDSIAVRQLKSDVSILADIAEKLEQSQKSVINDLTSLDERIVSVYEDLSARSTDASAVSAEVAKVFASFKKVTPVAEIEAIASTLIASKKVKAKDVFDGKLSYLLNGDEIDFSNLEINVFNDPEIPKRLNDYVFQPQHLHFALVALNNNLPHNVWLGGERGTGKTEFVTQLANRLGRKLYRINFDEAIERAEFIGGNTIEKGDVVWKEGIVTQAIQHQGALVLFDEIGFARASNIAILHSVCERTPHRALTVSETGKRIPVAQDVAFFVADNSLGFGDPSGNFTGVRDMNTAFLDRFSYTLKFEYLKAVDESALIVKRTGIKKDVADIIVKYANTAREKVKSGILTQPPSIRQLFAWADGVNSGLPMALAFEGSVINKFPSDCEPELRGIYSAVVNESAVKQFLRG
jgi:MoxR-like ATPase